MFQSSAELLSNPWYWITFCLQLKTPAVFSLTFRLNRGVVEVSPPNPKAVSLKQISWASCWYFLSVCMYERMYTRQQIWMKRHVDLKGLRRRNKTNGYLKQMNSSVFLLANIRTAFPVRNYYLKNDFSQQWQTITRVRKKNNKTTSILYYSAVECHDKQCIKKMLQHFLEREVGSSKGTANKCAECKVLSFHQLSRL